MDLFASLLRDCLPDCRTGIFLVGGSVRDLLLGRMPADIDIAVEGDIDRLADAIVRRTGARAIHLGSKPFAVVRIAAGERTIDIAPVNGPTIAADLAARDFTINAMAYDLAGGNLVDCTGGMADLNAKRIRMVSPAAFEKDPVRLVRAYRMAADLGWDIDGATRRAITRHRRRIAAVAGERVWAELAKILGSPNAAAVFQRMRDDDLLTSLFPELGPCSGCTQNAFHEFDVLAHSLLAMVHVEKWLNDVDHRFPELVETAGTPVLGGNGYLMKYAALLHDVGKPETRIVGDDGAIRFPGHARRSADIVREISRRLKLSRHEERFSDAVIRHHIRPLSLFLTLAKPTRGAMPANRRRIRFFNRCEPFVLPILIHAMADTMAKTCRPDRRNTALIDFCRRLIVDYQHARARRSATLPLINGNDLIQVLALTPSPLFKQILIRVDERRLAGELSSRDEALEWVRQWLKKHRADAGA